MGRDVAFKQLYFYSRLCFRVSWLIYRTVYAFEIIWIRPCPFLCHRHHLHLFPSSSLCLLLNPLRCPFLLFPPLLPLLCPSRPGPCPLVPYQAQKIDLPLHSKQARYLGSPSGACRPQSAATCPFSAARRHQPVSNHVILRLQTRQTHIAFEHCRPALDKTIVPLFAP